LTTSSGSSKSFLLEGGAYTEFAYPKALVTEALGLNWQDQIVGTYEDTSKAWHGFILTSPLSGPAWISVDEPKSDSMTVVSSISDTDYLVGYYLDSYGNTNGFLATPLGSSLRYSQSGRR
jgi:hypothetical protein